MYSIMAGNSGESTPSRKEYTIKVKEYTYKELFKLQKILELKFERRISMNDVILFLIAQTPPIVYEIKPLMEEEEHKNTNN